MKKLSATQIKDQNDADRFDVTPKDYADTFNVGKSSAYYVFESLLGKFVVRAGRSTAKYPGGKSLRMSRRYFESLKK